MRPRLLTSLIASLMVLSSLGCDKAANTGAKAAPTLKRMERVLSKVSASQKEAAKAFETLGGEILIDEDDADPLIEGVDFSHSRVTDADLEKLAGLTSIQSLDFQDTAISDEGIKHLAKLPNLVILTLSETKVTDEGLAVVAGFSSLKRLALNDLPLTDASIEHLKAIKSLDSVGIKGTKITPAGVQELKDALPDLQITE